MEKFPEKSKKESFVNGEWLQGIKREKIAENNDLAVKVLEYSQRRQLAGRVS